jgi:hypothetical protein
MQSSIAEAVFPLLVYDILLLNGKESEAGRLLSSRIATFMLAIQPTSSGTGSGIGTSTFEVSKQEHDDVCARVAQLASNTLVFLLRQNVRKFVDRSRVKLRTSATAAAATPKAALKPSTAEVWTVPYSYQLNIDLSFAATVAVRCGCVCTALLFTELADEARRAVEGTDPRNGGRVNIAIGREQAIVRYRDTAGASGTGRAGGSVAVTAAGMLSVSVPVPVPVYQPLSSETLMCIYKGIHDPDAIYAVNQSSNLELQALAYSHTGKPISLHEVVVSEYCLNVSAHATYAAQSN